jgi:hypothetical protein
MALAISISPQRAAESLSLDLQSATKSPRALCLIERPIPSTRVLIGAAEVPSGCLLLGDRRSGNVGFSGVAGRLGGIADGSLRPYRNTNSL